MATLGEPTDDELDTPAPVWAVFGDLMAGLLGAFVLILVLVIGVQLELASRLEAEVQQRQTLEQALAGPLAGGRVTLANGRIGISGSVLFADGSDQLQPELLMVSGFTDDRLLRSGNRQFNDNWELSAQRALTVTRALIDAGVPASAIFAAAFGPEQPVASNADAAGRAQNRRVEMAPVPRTAHGGRQVRG